PQLTATAFAVLPGSIEFWQERLRANMIGVAPVATRFGEPVLGFVDPDGMPLELVGTSNTAGTAWLGAGIPEAHAIRGFHGVSLSEEGYEKTARLLTDVMGFAGEGSEGNRFRY